MSVRYQREIKTADKPRMTEDWAEYAGCAQLEMSELITILGGGEGATDLLLSVVRAVHLVRPKTGEVISELTAESILKLRPQVLDWLRNQTREAARDEALDPEV